MFLVVYLAATLVSMGLEERCPREALLLVVKVVQVVFYVSTSNHTIFEKNLNFSYRY